MANNTTGNAESKEEEEVEFEPKKKVSYSVTFFAKLHAIHNFVWDPNTKQIIGRTWSSWAKIGLFYLVFYSCLASFFAIMLAGFFKTLDDRHPTQTGMYSLIKANPGMGFRPMPNIESTLIRYSQGVKETYKKHTDSIDQHLSVYRERAKNPRGVNCSDLPANYSHGDDDTMSFCEFDLSQLGTECTPENNYGYHENKPCVLLKINKVYDWQPRAFTDMELNDTHNHFAQEAKQKMGRRIDTSYIGVTCEGENEGDADNLRGIKYFPDKGFPFKYYPYYNQPGYLAPIVFVQFDTPKEGVLIQVWCKLWVSNIKHHKNDKAGSIHFELLVN